MSFLLLFGAGLFVRSLQNLQTTDTGVQMDNLVTFRLSPALSGYDNPRTVNLYNELLDRLRSTPGIKSAGHAGVSILSGDEWDSTTSVEGHDAKDGEDMQAFMNALSPGYFETMGIKLLDGRDFRASDIVENPKIAIVNRKFAQHFFGDKSAIGKRLGRGAGPRDEARRRDHRRRRRLALRRPARRRPPPGVLAGIWRQLDVLRAHHRSVVVRVQRDQERSEAARCGHAGV